MEAFWQREVLDRPLVSAGKYYIPSNDFPVMICRRMFSAFALLKRLEAWVKNRN